MAIGIKRGLTVTGRDFFPQLSRALAAAITDIEGNDLPALHLQREPEPLRVGFLADKAPGFVRFDHQALNDDLVGLLWQPHIEIIGGSGVTADDKIDQPTQLTRTARQMPRSDNRSFSNRLTKARSASLISRFSADKTN